jgi:hypothetical protein
MALFILSLMTNDVLRKSRSALSGGEYGSPEAEMLTSSDRITAEIRIYIPESYTREAEYVK